jgi:hypothetical protein
MFWLISICRASCLIVILNFSTAVLAQDQKEAVKSVSQEPAANVVGPVFCGDTFLSSLGNLYFTPRSSANT